MRHILHPQTLMVMLSAGLIAALAIYFRDANFLSHMLFRVLYFGEIFFHEFGHTVFFWLFGSAAVPSIMTIFGGDKAGGFTLVLGEHWSIQLISIGALIYACWHCWHERRLLFYPLILFTCCIIAASFTSAREWLPIYMGQGGSMIAASVLMYRAWLDVAMRHIAERWLNAVYGFFVLFHNAWFAHQLMGDTAEKARYISGELTMDFVAITEIMWRWTLHGIALFTLVLSVAVLIVSLLAAAYFAEDEYYDTGL